MTLGESDDGRPTLGRATRTDWVVAAIDVGTSTTAQLPFKSTEEPSGE